MATKGLNDQIGTINIINLHWVTQSGLCHLGVVYEREKPRHPAIDRNEPYFISCFVPHIKGEGHSRRLSFLVSAYSN